MGRLAWSQLRFRAARTVALLAGMLLAARCERLIRLRDGAVVDDIELAGDGLSAEDVIRRASQLG